MRRYTVVQVDAFTTLPLQGNPCAVLSDARRLTDAEMQSIARDESVRDGLCLSIRAGQYHKSCVNSFRPQLNCGRTGNLHTTRHTAPRSVRRTWLPLLCPSPKFHWQVPPTISTAHVLVEEGRVPLKDGRSTFMMVLNVGVLPVEIHIFRF